MHAMFVVPLAAVITALGFAGCIEQPAPAAAPIPQPEGDAETSAHSPKWKIPSTTPYPPRDASTVVYAGHIYAPDPSHHDYQKGCFGYGGGYELATMGVTHVSFTFKQSHNNWTYAFDVPGLVAHFHGGRWTDNNGMVGRVPDGSTSVTVCSRVAVNTDFRLTLSPPDRAQQYLSTWIVGAWGIDCGTNGLPNPCCDGDLHRTQEIRGEGTTFDRFAIDPNTHGLPFRIHARTEVPTVAFAGLRFVDADGNHVGRTMFIPSLAGSTSAHGSGVVPHQASSAVFFSCASGPIQLDYRAGTWNEIRTEFFAGEFSLAEWTLCPGSDTAVAARSARFHWTLPVTLADGSPAIVDGLELHYASRTTPHAIIYVEGPDGRHLATARDDLVLRHPQPGTYTISVSGCHATTGKFSLTGIAELRSLA